MAIFVFGTMLLGPLLNMLITKMNGGPFAVGDRGLILAGPHKDQVGPIYELRKERSQVRVYLGEEEKEKVKDVIKDHQVWRVAEDKSEGLEQQS